MLIVQLARESRVLIGSDVEIVVMRIHDGAVRLGIAAPADMRISRVGDDVARRTHYAKQALLDNPLLAMGG